MVVRLLRVLPLFASLAFVACGGGSDSSTATSTGTAPSITTEPESATVVAGNGVSFSVVATGSATLTYQWRKGGTAISGATSASYAIASVAAADGGSYDVVVANAAGSVTSAAATLTVTDASGTVAPSITTQPASVAAAVGGAATFTVVASGTAPLTYQWSKDGVSIAGATSASYTIASAAATDAGSYTVTVTNTAAAVTSDAATLTVGSTDTSTESAAVTAAAQAFYGTLTTTQKSSVQLAWSLDTARRWSNLPAALSGRNGVSWGALSTAQKAAATTLMSTALSTTGTTLFQGLQAADDYLNTIGGGSSYGNGNYYVAFVGAPSATDFWVLQLTGHHITYNIAYNGSVVSSTPMFLGIEPRQSFTSGGATYDPMAAQRTAVSDLGTALASYAGASLSGTYADLLFGATGSGGIDGTYPKSYPTGTSGRGVLYGALSTSDQEKVKAVIRSYVNTQASAHADTLLAAYLSDSALAQTYVAYAGGGNVVSSGSYVRVDGPRVWIEFSVQRGVIISSDTHYHTVWRDKTGDFGGRCCS